MCPQFLIGQITDIEQGPWLEVSFASGVKPLPVDSTALAEGMFGPERKRAWFPDQRHPRSGWADSVVPFRVQELGAVKSSLDDRDAVLERLGPTVSQKSRAR